MDRHVCDVTEELKAGGTDDAYVWWLANTSADPTSHQTVISCEGKSQISYFFYSDVVCRWTNVLGHTVSLHLSRHYVLVFWCFDA